MNADKANLSIHPRNWPQAPTSATKSNTSTPKLRSTVERAIAGIAGHLERNPRDAMSELHMAKLKASLSSYSRA